MTAKAPWKRARGGWSVRAAMYVRSASGTSTRAQSARCREVAELQGAQIVETIVDDRVDGRSLERPGLVLLRAVLARRDVDAVIIARRDRLSLDPEQLQTLSEEIEKQGVRLVVAEEVDDEAPH